MFMIGRQWRWIVRQCRMNRIVLHEKYMIYVIRPGKVMRPNR